MNQKTFATPAPRPSSARHALAWLGGLAFCLASCGDLRSPKNGGIIEARFMPSGDIAGFGPSSLRIYKANLKTTKADVPYGDDIMSAEVDEESLKYPLARSLCTDGTVASILGNGSADAMDLPVAVMTVPGDQRLLTFKVRDFIGMHLSPRCDLLAMAYATKLEVFRVSDGTRLWLWEGPIESSDFISFSPDNRRLFAVGDRYEDGNSNVSTIVRSFDAETGAVLLDMRENVADIGHVHAWVTGIGFTPDSAGLVVQVGRFLDDTRGPSTFEVWNASTGQVQSSVVLPPEARVSGLAVSPDGAYYLTGGKGDESTDFLQLWKPDGTLVRSVEIPNQPDRGNFITSFSIAPDGKSYAVVDAYGTLTVYSIADGSVLAKMVPDPIEK
jgi:WD40 repeat protein